jgi:hypothetical protein
MKDPISLTIRAKIQSVNLKKKNRETLFYFTHFMHLFGMHNLSCAWYVICHFQPATLNLSPIHLGS